MLLILTANGLVIFSITNSSKLKKKSFQQVRVEYNVKKSFTTLMSSSSKHSNYETSQGMIKKRYQSICKLAELYPQMRKKKLSRNLTIMLIIVSVTFVLFNSPNMIVWTVYLYEQSDLEIDLPHKNYIFSSLKIAEIFQ